MLNLAVLFIFSVKQLNRPPEVYAKAVLEGLRRFTVDI